MKKAYNSQYFTKEDVESGLMTKFISMLCDMCYAENSEFYNELMIKPEDLGAFTVNWVQKYWDNNDDECGRFDFIDSDEVIMREVFMPDDSCVLVGNQDEEKEVFDDWLKEHPTWKQNWMGRWYDSSEDVSQPAEDTQESDE